MKMIPIVSSNLSGVRYGKFKRELIVEFKGGSQFLYKKVPVKVFDELMASESKGKYFHANVKGKFETVKIKEKDKKKNDE